MLWLFVRNVILKIVLEMGSSKGSSVTDVKAVDISKLAKISDDCSYPVNFEAIEVQPLYFR